MWRGDPMTNEDAALLTGYAQHERVYDEEDAHLLRTNSTATPSKRWRS
jgi:hypothetical protein